MAYLSSSRVFMRFLYLYLCPKHRHNIIIPIRMKEIKFSAGLFLCLAASAFAQTPDSGYAWYRGAANPYYWKNRSPYAGYWQQDVYYHIRANVDERTDIIDGQE